MGHVRDTSDSFTQARPGSSAEQGAAVRFSADQIGRLSDAGLLNPDIRFELIDGEIVEMAPDRGPHTTAKSALARWLGRSIGDDLHVGAEVTFKLAETTLVVPEVAVWRPLKTSAYLPADRLILAVEIVTTDPRSALQKAAHYARVGVPEIWIVDLAHRVTHALSQAGGGDYANHSETAFADPLALPVDPARGVVMAAILD